MNNKYTGLGGATKATHCLTLASSDQSEDSQEPPFLVLFEVLDVAEPRPFGKQKRRPSTG
jgi:hypothetical protein